MIQRNNKNTEQSESTKTIIELKQTTLDMKFFVLNYQKGLLLSFK